jgi:hypothetical protein
MMKRKTILHLHISLAGLCIPFLLVYLITGILYTFGIKGDFVTKKEALHFSQTIEPKADVIESEFTKILQERNEKIPTGEITIRKAGTSWQAIWNGSDCEHILEPLAEAEKYQLTLKHVGWHRYLVQLHKAKGGMVFKVFSGLMGLFLISLLALGVSLSMSSKAMRYEIGFCILIGTLLLVISAIYS